MLSIRDMGTAGLRSSYVKEIGLLTLKGYIVFGVRKVLKYIESSIKSFIQVEAKMHVIVKDQSIIIIYGVMTFQQSGLKMVGE